MKTQTTPVDSIAERRKRWRHFLQPDAEPGFLFIVNCADPQVAIPSMPHRWPNFKKQRIEAAWNSYQAQVRRAELIDDDSIPYG